MDDRVESIDQQFDGRWRRARLTTGMVEGR
jgi:hypothetical protein